MIFTPRNYSVLNGVIAKFGEKRAARITLARINSTCAKIIE